MTKVLTAKGVEKIKRPGRHRCGLVRGLYLQVSKSGAKSWLLRYEINGVKRWHGLGSAADVPLREARARAKAKRLLIVDGIDPVTQRRVEKTKRLAATSTVKSFGECAEAFFRITAPSWTSRVHARQWMSAVLGRTPSGKGAQPDYLREFRSIPVADITTAHVIAVLTPIWHLKNETARRLANRVEKVLSWATVSGFRSGPNPAVWRGHLDLALPGAAKKMVNHFEAIPYPEMPEFMADLRSLEGVDARALEFLILTAARSGEVLGARWNEIDQHAKIWTIPATRIKAGKEHRVPLPLPAIDLLNGLPREHGSPHIFIGASSGAGLGSLAMLKVLRRLGRTETVHGFRSAFSDWAHECTAHSHHAIEISLAHKVGSAVEMAYRRGDQFQKRAHLMDDWCRFLWSPAETAERLRQ